VTDRHERISDELARVPLFEGLSRKELQQVAELSTYLERPVGAVLTREGHAGHEFIVVLEGEVEVRRDGEVLATLGPGSHVGEIALLEHRPRTATVVATTPVAIEVISQHEFTGLLAEVPEIAQKLLPTMAKRLAELEERAGS
jgi:CRP/FNR family transcriptional regulator, cyclic AMP receptor protein